MTNRLTGSDYRVATPSRFIHKYICKVLNRWEDSNILKLTIKTITTATPCGYKIN